MGRLKYIDILKGWSILCIVLLHYEEGIFPGWLNAWIGNFMISAFYFTSGWMAGIKQKDITVKELAKKRMQSLGKPYLYFSALIIGFDLILLIFGYYDLKFIGREIYKTIVLRGIGTLWFLPALFGGEILFRWILNRRNVLFVIFAVILSLFFIHYYGLNFKYRNVSDITRIIEAPFYTLRNMIFAWPVIGIAYLTSIYFHNTVAQMKSYVIIGIGLLITSMSIYYNGGFCPFSLGILTYLIAPVIGPLGLLLLAYPFKRGILVKFFSFWGENSLVMMVIHYSILLVLCKIIDQAFFNVPFTGVRTLVWFVITVIVSYPIVWFFNHKARWMLGKS